MSQTNEPTHCSQCGGLLITSAVEDDNQERLVCRECRHICYVGPKVLVLAIIIADNKALLIRRGQPPYKGKWANPGGYVEAGESLEAAAAREVEEEVGIKIPCEEFLPTATISLPHINQVCVALLAMLEDTPPLYPAAPEALDARWFSLDNFPYDEVWDPLLTVDLVSFYTAIKARRFRFVQRLGDKERVIFTSSGLSHPWAAHSLNAENHT